MKGIGQGILKVLAFVGKAKKISTVITIVVEAVELVKKRLHEEGVIIDEDQLKVSKNAKPSN